jgi:hypothetical protein
MTKHYRVEIVDRILYSLLQNKTFMQKKDLPMNQGVVRRVVLLRSNNQVEIGGVGPIEEAADMVVLNEKCFPQLAQLAEIKLKFLFNPRVKSPYIAETASNLAQGIKYHLLKPASAGF